MDVDKIPFSCDQSDMQYCDSRSEDEKRDDEDYEITTASSDDIDENIILYINDKEI